MTVPYTFVALLDVLGYRSKIDADRQRASEDFKTKLEAALAILTGLNETEISYQAISDTIIIANHPSARFCDLLRTLKRVHLAFLQQGLFLRGGIAFAPHFKSGPITYSHALPVAYQLEQTQAVYPRIVIDSNIIEMFSGDGKLSAEAGDVQSERLICVENGIYFVNVAHESADEYYELARGIYQEEESALHGREHELAKHRWLQNYIAAISGVAREPYIKSLGVFFPQRWGANADEVEGGR
ncbi:hypothetical protein [Pseudoxanthomonas sp. GW2]|uniref:hypothetical protein n=1 Tax=Pseudoxanthomonas sp. GW2 TaxID=1211114 RepID=UPI0012EA7AAD|nr:hypothetical protein [Pseudoxanthomonas sp. GW2]